MRMAMRNHSKAAGRVENISPRPARISGVSAGMALDERQHLLDFWFGTPGSEGCDQFRSIWFDSTPEFDRALGERFGALAERAAKGALDPWAEDANGALALVLLLDQLPRNCHRGTARAFACDEKARDIARAALATGLDRALRPVRRLFLYLPFMHSETLADQEESLRLFAAISADEDAGWLRSARHHHAIIARFGRFPHRNGVLGRVSSRAEEDFLREPNSSF
jgi:uncharacterized protein (DUF924 family)